MQKKSFITADMDEGALLLSLGETFIGTKVAGNGYITFEFEYSPTIEKSHQEYLSGCTTIPTNILFANLRKIRSMYLRTKQEGGIR